MFKVIQWAIVGLKSRLSHAVFILVSVIPKILKRKVSSSNRWLWKFSSLSSNRFRASSSRKVGTKAKKKIFWSDFLSRRLFRVNKSRSRKLGKRSRDFLVGRQVSRLLLNWRGYEIARTIRELS